MGLSDFKFPILLLVGVFIYVQFFQHGHHEHSKLQISSDTVLFHANWTKSLDDLCCLGKINDAFNLDGINNLDVSLSMSSFNQEQLRKIFNIQKFQPYKNIRLDLSGLNISNSGVLHVLNLIQPNVQTLQLYLNGLKTQQGFGSALAERLNTFVRVKTLKVSLIMSLKNKQVDSLLATHNPSNELDSFDLVLIGNDINKQGLGNLQTYFSRLDVNHLHFNLYANKLGAQGAQILSKALKQKSGLESLNLDLYFNNITQVGTQNITSALQTFTNLKSLQLNLDFNYIKNQGGKFVGKMLQKFTTLQQLSLGVASKNFGYLGYKHVIDGLSKLTQLKKLSLRCGINRVGVNGAQITKEMLAKMNDLQELELGFIQNYIGDDGIALLAEQAASMKKIKSLNLNLAFNDAKSWGLIKVIKTFLNHQYQFFRLSLSFNQFRDNDVKLIENHLATLIKNNEQFVFEFVDTAISKVEMARLQKVFSDANQKYGKEAKLSVNSIIAEEQPEKQEKKQAPKPAAAQTPKTESAPKTQQSNNQATTKSSSEQTSQNTSQTTSNSQL